MSDPNYSRHKKGPDMPLFAKDDPPRQTKRQQTRWSTSDEAFLNASSKQPLAILEYIKTVPSTCDEVEIALGMTHQSCSAAINRLMRLGHIFADGSRLTRSGRSARVWHYRRSIQ